MNQHQANALPLSSYFPWILIFIAVIATAIATRTCRFAFCMIFPCISYLPVRHLVLTSTSPRAAALKPPPLAGEAPLLLLSAPPPYAQNDRTDTQQAQRCRLGNNDFQIRLGRIAIFIQHC